MDPTEAALIRGQAAKTLAGALGSETDAGARLSLASALSEVAGRMDPTEAARISGTPPGPSTEAFGRKQISKPARTLASALSGVVGRMDPTEAARIHGHTTKTLAEALGRATVDAALFMGESWVGSIVGEYLASTLSEIAGRMDRPKPRIRGQAAKTLAGALDREEEGPCPARALPGPLRLSTYCRDYATLTETLRPVRKALLTPLARVFRDAGRLESERSFATTILIDYASDDPPLLADLLMEAGPKAFASLFPVAQQQAAGVLPVLQAEIARSLTSVNEEGSEEAKDRLAQRQARAAIALVRLGDADLVWPLLRHSADPRLRSFIVNWLNPLGADPRMLAELVRRMGGAWRVARRCRELTSSVEKSHGTRRTCLLPPRATLHPPPRTWPSSIGCLHPPPVTRHPPPKRWMPSSSTPRPQSAAP